MRRRQGGFSLIEIVIVLAITAVILVATFMVIFSVTRGNEALAPRVKLQLEATRVLREMCALLKTSGPSEFLLPGTYPPKGDGKWQPGEYPAFAAYTPTSGLNNKWAPPYDFLNANNLSVTPNAPATDTDIYPTYILDANAAPSTLSVEIAFRVPKTTELNKVYPTDPVTGAVEWGTDIIAIVLLPGNFGNELQMRWYDATAFNLVRTVVLSRDVERIVFQSAAGSFYGGDAKNPTPITVLNDPLNLKGDEMRVILWFWTRDINGNVIKLSQGTTFNFRSISR
jgi:prepilin-type N-terminal cleavage/methylation domain-containing protein